MNFSDALRSMKKGDVVRRACWGISIGPDVSKRAFLVNGKPSPSFVLLVEDMFATDWLIVADEPDEA